MIVYDFREERSGIPKQLKELGIDVLDADMSLGDYKIISPNNIYDHLDTHITVLPGDNSTHKHEVIKEFKRNIEDLYGILIETKRDKDFSTSIKTRHMNDQLWRQSKDYYASILIIEGSLKEICQGTGINFEQAQAAIDSAIMKRALEGLRGNISVITTQTRTETIRHLINFDKYVTGIKNIERKDKTVRIISKKDIKRNLQATLASFPGIDDIRAKAILKIYPSIEEIVTCTAKDLEVVDGIGKKLSKQIVDYIRYKIDILDDD